MTGQRDILPAARIRRVEPEDWQSYRALRLRALGSDPLAFGSTLERERDFTEDRWRDRIARGSPSAPSSTWAAVDATQRFVGMVVAARVDDAFHIFAMWVAPEVRREGLGGRLLDAALAWVEIVAPGSDVQLEVNPSQEAAVHLYRSRRFEPTDRSSPLDHSPGERLVEMIRSAGKRGPLAPENGRSAIEARPIGKVMKTIEIRRHSVRDKPEEHLSGAGRELARHVGREAGPFGRVFSSPSLRAVETANEMGFLDPELRREWEELGPEINAEVGWPSPFTRYALPLRSESATRRKARALLSDLEEMLRSLPDPGRGLVVTHGGFPELIAVALFPTSDHRAWGGPLRCMEGVRISYEGQLPKECMVLRLPQPATRL